MSTRQNNGSHCENHQRAVELQDPAHAHDVAEQHGKQDHLTGHEHSRQALEHSPDRPQHTRAATQLVHGIAAFGHEEISALAHELWQARGYPDGSQQEDWFHAAEQLRSSTHGR
jgi:DUF2934 family protein